MDTIRRECFCCVVRIFGKWAKRVLSVLLVGLLLFCWWARQRDAKRFETAPLAGNELRVMTWNVGYFSPVPDKNMRVVDVEQVARLLEKSDAGVVVFQELGSLEMGTALALALGEAWTFVGVETGLGNQVLGVLTRFECVEQFQRDCGRRKIFGVTLSDGREEFFVVGLHAPHPIRRGEGHTFACIQGAFELAMEYGKGRALVLGDLNVAVDSKEDIDVDEDVLRRFDEVTGQIGDTYYAGRRLDYIFIEKALGWQVHSGKSGMMDLDDQWPGMMAVPGPRDHRPVVVTFRR